MVTVRTGARLHLGFQNLSLAHERLYGGVGLALAEPVLELTAEPGDTVECPDAAVEPILHRVVDCLGVPGARVDVTQTFPRHVGLGSGTQLALATLVAVARAHDVPADPRSRAPDLGRGGRSGVGVATFEHGGFVVDGGHPTERFTTDAPERGDWTVPEPIARHPVPSDWRFVLVIPDAPAGPSGQPEDERIRTVVERADPGIADDIASVLTRRLLPAIATGDHGEFGSSAARLGRLNGAWYADEQGGIYRPPAGRIVEALDAAPEITGAGQSSWGPTVYGVTHVDDADRARAVGEAALDRVDRDGSVHLVSARNDGADID